MPELTFLSTNIPTKKKFKELKVSKSHVLDIFKKKYLNEREKTAL